MKTILTTLLVLLLHRQCASLAPLVAVVPQTRYPLTELKMVGGQQQTDQGWLASVRDWFGSITGMETKNDKRMRVARDAAKRGTDDAKALAGKAKKQAGKAAEKAKHPFKKW